MPCAIDHYYRTNNKQTTHHDIISILLHGDNTNKVAEQVSLLNNLPNYLTVLKHSPTE